MLDSDIEFPWIAMNYHLTNPPFPTNVRDISVSRFNGRGSLEQAMESQLGLVHGDLMWTSVASDILEKTMSYSKCYII